MTEKLSPHIVERRLNAGPMNPIAPWVTRREVKSANTSTSPNLPKNKYIIPKGGLCEANAVSSETQGLFYERGLPAIK